MGVTRLDPPVWVATPLGDAEAEFLIDRGPEHHLQWVCWLIHNGECWVFRNPEIRRTTNLTMGRDGLTPFSAETLARFHWGPHEREHPPGTAEAGRPAGHQP